MFAKLLSISHRCATKKGHNMKITGQVTDDIE